MNDQDRPVSLTVKGARPAGAVSRREAMKWVMAAVAASSLPKSGSGQLPDSAHEEGRNVIPQEAAAKLPDPTFKGGYGTDPKLVKRYKPGEVWPLTLNDAQKKTAAALADMILPRDEYGPAASEVGVVAMIDEWVSAPYPQQQSDRPVVLEGLAWVEAESARRFGKGFADLSPRQASAICDDVCFERAAKPEFKQAARFFGRFRSLCAGAYYATPPGWKALGYVGNTPLVQFDGPPPEVLEKLGVTQTVQ